ncbi:MAG: hypothetical protein Q9225_007864, partial [Loekoesia sp. 1 TL-2023]
MAARSCLHQLQLHSPSVNIKSRPTFLNNNTARQLLLTTMAATPIRSKLDASLDSLNRLVRLTEEPQYRYGAEVPTALWRHQLVCLRISSSILASLDSRLQSDPLKLNEMLYELEILEAELAETRNFIRHGPRAMNATSTNSVSVDQHTAEANAREHQAFLNVVSNNPQVFELWMKHGSIADSID